MPAQPRRGAARAEVILSVVLLATALGLMLPAVHAAQNQDAHKRGQNQLKQLALAMHNTHDVYGRFPPTVGNFIGKQGTVFYFMLPYLEQQQLFQKNDISVPVPLFQSPLDRSVPADYRHQGWLATTSYAANWLVFLDHTRGVVRIQNITDGTSNTMAFAERYQLCNDTPCGWGYSTAYYWAPMFAHYSQGKYQQTPKGGACDPSLAQALDAAGINVAMCDGSVRTQSPQTSPRTWAALCTPNGGERVEEN
jgi:prepilin-type processing-associated H-X9-DG protein